MTVNNESDPSALATPAPAEPPPVVHPSLAEGLRLLVGHTSQETAYIQPDYPSGWLRCKRACWIETHPKHGQRFCAATTNPKRVEDRWYTPKKSTYTALLVMVLDERPGKTQGHITTDGLHWGEDEAAIDAFEAMYGAVLTDSYARETLLKMRAATRASKHFTYVIRQEGDAEQEGLLGPKEARHAMGRAFAFEYQKLAAAT
jgi:hypothetical protein